MLFTIQPIGVRAFKGVGGGGVLGVGVGEREDGGFMHTGCKFDKNPFLLPLQPIMPDCGGGEGWEGAFSDRVSISC